MTIDSVYSEETFSINPAGVYTFEFQSIGPESIEVYGIDSNGNATYISPDNYTLVMGGSVPIYTGGTISFTVPATYPPDTVQILVSRNTPETQTVDYQPYTPFPAETTEFALDKLTLIAQEKAVYGSGGGTDPGTPIDPNLYVPIAGTKVGKPITGALEYHNTLNVGGDWYMRVLGDPWNGFYTFPKANVEGTYIGWINNGHLATFDDKGYFNQTAVIDADADPQVLVTKQYVDDAVGGPGGAFVPLAGTQPGAPITGVIHFENSNLSIEWVFGITEGVLDVMTLAPANATSANLVIATGPDTNTQQWGFNTSGELLLPNIDYSLADNQAAVNKLYVDLLIGGGISTYVKLAGTDPGAPITGNLEFQDIGNNQEWLIGVSNIPGYTDGFAVSSGGASGDPSNFYVNCRGTIFQFRSDNATFFAPNIAVGVSANPGPYQLFVEGDVGINGGILAEGAIFNGVVITGSAAQYDLSVTGDTQLNGNVLAGNIICGSIGATTVSMSSAQGTAGGAATRKDYVDGLNAANVKLSGNQTISGTKTFTGTIDMNGECDVNGLATSNSEFVMVNNNGKMYRGGLFVPAATFEAEMLQMKQRIYSAMQAIESDPVKLAAVSTALEL